MSDSDAPPRSQLPMRVFRLGEEPGDNLSSSTTAEERILMVDVLSRRMWELTGKPWPQIPRAEWPVRVIRRK